jgi:hypothetical protein
MADEIIHIQWEGPFTLAEVADFTDRQQDYGIYHVCGPHPSYGRDVLLYIGKAARQTYGKRLLQEGWEGWQTDRGSVRFFLGRLHGSTTPAPAVWNAEIDRVEQLLILAHRPAHNAKGLYKNNRQDLHQLHVLNWGERGALMPEVSGARWSSRFSRIANYAPYGSHRGQSDSFPPATNGDDSEGDELVR